MNVKPVKNPVTATIEGFVAMTHSSSVHQKCGGQHQTSKSKAIVGKGFWKPEYIILIKERGTRRMGWCSVVIATSKHAELGTAQEFYCLRVEE